jgi:hypothetical protein
VIDMGAIVHEGAVLEKNSVLAPSSVLGPGERVPTGQLWSGSPAKFERALSAQEIADIAKQSEGHYLLSRKHLQVHHEFEQEMRAIREFEARDPGQDWKEERSASFDAADPAFSQPRIGEVPNKV